jgi:hypothetical protein
MKDENYDALLETLMNKVPGVRLGNTPIAIVDVDGDGVVEILGFIIYGHEDDYHGQLFIHTYYTDINMYDLQRSYTFAIINNIPRINFNRRNNRIEIDYEQASDH